MTLTEFNRLLADHTDVPLHIMLPDGAFVPSHFHVTEVGYVYKIFIDCGGTQRISDSCVLQVWVADDVDHRLDSTKLATIMKSASTIFAAGEFPVEIEYGADVAATYAVSKVSITPGGLLFELKGKQTDCLAPDKCGVSSCGPRGCC